MSRLPMSMSSSVTASCSLLLLTFGLVGPAHADSMSTLIAQKSTQSTSNTSYRYPDVSRQTPTVLPAFLSGDYDNIDSEYLPLLSSAETQSSLAAREVVSTARKMP